MNSYIRYGTHLPALMAVVNKTNGPIIEFGTGLFSTPYLHWVCFTQKRKLVSYESDYETYKANKDYQNDYHDVHYVENWDEIDMSDHWDVALIDHAPAERRHIDIARIAKSAKYVIAHDSEGRNDKNYKYSEIYKLFKYRHDFTDVRPHTTILSNYEDLSSLKI